MNVLVSAALTLKSIISQAVLGPVMRNMIMKEFNILSLFAGTFLELKFTSLIQNFRLETAYLSLERRVRSFPAFQLHVWLVVSSSSI